MGLVVGGTYLGNRNRVLESDPVEDNFPKVCDPDSPPVPKGREPGRALLGPQRQSFEWLETAWKLSVHNMKKGTRKKRKPRAYMRACAVANSIIEILWEKNQPNREQSAGWRSKTRDE